MRIVSILENQNEISYKFESFKLFDRKIDFNIKKGFNLICGDSGVGKTSLLYNLSGLYNNQPLIEDSGIVLQFPIKQVTSIIVRDEISLFSNDEFEIVRLIELFGLDKSIMDKNIMV